MVPAVTADGRVPPERPPVSVSRIVAGAPVRAQTWLDAASLAHWVAGRGQVVIPGHSVRYELSGTVTMRYRVPLSGRAIARVACVGIRSDTGATREVTVTMGSGTTTAFVGELTLGSQVPIYVQDDGVTRTDAVTDIEIDVTGTDVVIESCAVYELPRASLSRDATDLGVALDTLFPRRPIMDSGAQSVRGVAALMQGVDGRRIGHFARWGDVVGGAPASFTSILRAPYRIVPRYAVSGLREVSVYLLARITSGTGEIRVVAGSGDTATVSLSTTLAWLSPLAVDVVCEDPAEPDGLTGGSYDTIDIETRRISGLGTIEIEAWTCVELT